MSESRDISDVNGCCHLPLSFLCPSQCQDFICQLLLKNSGWPVRCSWVALKQALPFQLLLSNIPCKNIGYNKRFMASILSIMAFSVSAWLCSTDTSRSLKQKGNHSQSKVGCIHENGESYLFKDLIKRLFFFFSFPNLDKERISSCKSKHVKCYLLITKGRSKDNVCFKEAERLTMHLQNYLSLKV